MSRIIYGDVKIAVDRTDTDTLERGLIALKEIAPRTTGSIASLTLPVTAGMAAMLTEPLAPEIFSSTPESRWLTCTAWEGTQTRGRLTAS